MAILETKYTEIQLEVAKYLSEIEPKSGNIFLGAISALENEANPDRISQSAHSIRECITVLTRKVESARQSSDNKNKDGLKRKIQTIATPINEPPEHLESPYTKLMKMYDDFLAITHHGGETPSYVRYIKKIEEFEALIISLVRPFFQGINEIDRILKKRKLSKKDAKRMMILIGKDQESYKYFFDNAGKKWLSFLQEKKYFDKPHPKKIIDGVARFQPWYESQYLARITPELPKQVCEIITSCIIPKNPQDRDSWVIADFVYAGSKMPPNYAIKIASKLVEKNWIEKGYYSRLNSVVADFMLMLGKSGKVTESLQVAKKLFNVYLAEIPSYSSFFPATWEVKSIIGSYSYENFMQSKMLEIAKVNPIKVIQFLIELLELVIKLDNKAKKVKGNHDLSYVWRPSIEESSQNLSSEDAKGIIITTLREALKQIDHNSSLLKKAMRMIKQVDYPIFKRFELHVCRLHPKTFKIECERIAIECFNEIEEQREYYLFMNETYPKLSHKTKQKILKMIKNGQDFTTWKNDRKKRGLSIEKKVIEDRIKSWAVSKLQPIIGYEPSLKKKYQQLVKEVGEWSYPGYSSYSSTSWGKVKPQSELNEKMKIKDVFSFIQSYQVTDELYSFDDGTVQVFRQIVEKNAYEYSKNTSLVLNAKPVFVYSFISGISDAIRNNVKIDWNGMLSLFEYIIAPKNKKQFGRMFSNVMHQVCEVLVDAFRTKKSLPSFKERKRIWEILKFLAEFKESSSMEEGDYSDNNFDSHGIAINTIRGKTMQTVLSYNDWVNNEQKLTTKKIVNEVKELLTKHVDVKNDNTISSRGVLGLNYPYLLTIDKKWTESNKKKIFATNNIILNNATWDAYLLTSVYQNTFQSLNSDYKNRIKLLKNALEKKGITRDPNKRLIEHVVVAYVANLKDSEKLFDEILKTAHTTYIKYLIHFVAHHILKPEKENPSQDLKRIKSLWTSGRLCQYKELGNWFTFSPFDKKYNIERLLSVLQETKGGIDSMLLVPKELSTYADDFPSETLDCLELILKFNPNKMEIHFNLDAFKKILETTKKKRNSKIKKKTTQLINLMGQLGYTEFRKLL